MADGIDGVAAKAQFAYDEWMESLGLPIYRGYFVPDAREIEVARWEERGCSAAFIQLVGQEGVSEARITEVAPGETSAPHKMAVDEIVYVLSGNGAALVWSDDIDNGYSFEWRDRALFMVPPNYYRQFSNTRGDVPLRLLHYNYLPLGMSVVSDPDFFFNNPYSSRAMGKRQLASVFSEAQERTDGGQRWVTRKDEAPRTKAYWYGNFFPDMHAWDKLDPNADRGAGGKTVGIQFANSDMSCHMSAFAPFTYKKAHRHGPGRVIVIPTGEGYTVMWREGGERIVIPWQEAALFVPPDRWFHQHFNVGSTSARYLALHPPQQFAGYAATKEERARDQVEYPDEDPWIRKAFEEELAKRGLASKMPDEAYREREYVWKL